MSANSVRVNWAGLASITAIAALVVSACGGAEPTATPRPIPTSAGTPAAPATSAPLATPTPTPAPTAVPPTPTAAAKYGGVLTLMSGRSPDHFDIHQQTPMRALGAITPAYNQLVQRQDKNDSVVMPDLAERWEITEGGARATFFLRKDVRFHNGTPVTSADVVTSLSRLVNPPAGVLTAWKELLPTVTKVEASDDYTVIITLSQPQASFLLGVSWPAMAMYSKSFLAEKGDMKKDVMGAGPFKFKAFTPGVTFELEKNPTYYLKDRPYLDGVKYIVVRDVAAQIAALKTSQVLMARPAEQTLSAAEEKDIAKDGKYTATPAILPWSNYVAGNQKRAPWGDVRVRKAMDMIFDREAFIRVVMEGQGVLGGWTRPTGPWAIPDSELRKRPGFPKPTDKDIADAKKLMADAGYPNGLETTLIDLADTGSGSRPQAEFVQEQLTKIGIKAKLEKLESAIYQQRLAKRDFDLARIGVGISQDEPDVWLGQYTSTGSVNYWGSSSPRIDELFLQQSRELNVEKRKALVLQIVKILDEEVPQAILDYQVQSFIVSARVKNFFTPSAQKLGLRYENVWLTD